MQAIILAAGFGTRLKPYTDTLPKALVRCNGKPMIDHAIEYLMKSGVDHIIVNVHHFGELIIDHLQTSKYDVGLSISDERVQLKDTGGALVAALPLMKKEKKVLVFNTDVITNMDISALYNTHAHNENSATLIVQNRESSRKLAFNRDGQLTGWINYKTNESIGTVPSSRDDLFAFSGIHLIDLDLIRHFESIYGDHPFPMIPAYLNSLKEYRIGSFLASENTMWLETGDPARLLEAEQFLKQENK